MAGAAVLGRGNAGSAGSCPGPVPSGWNQTGLSAAAQRLPLPEPAAKRRSRKGSVEQCGCHSSLVAGLAVGNSGFGVFKVVLAFGEEGRVVFSASFWQNWLFLPSPHS